MFFFLVCLLVALFICGGAGFEKNWSSIDWLKRVMKGLRRICETEGLFLGSTWSIRVIRSLTSGSMSDLKDILFCLILSLTSPIRRPR